MNIQLLELILSVLVWTRMAFGVVISDPVCVSRRQGRDFVYTDMECTLNGMVCPSAQPTYLISDEVCTSDQSLVSQCSLQLVPMESTVTDTIIAVAIENGSLLVYTTPFFSVPVQLVYYNQTGSPDNCSIASLEVYRGENTSIEISHNGFTIRDNYTIMVEEGQLAYDRADYDGELYRMNVSCDDVMTNESCLFFKLQSDQAASIGNGKFNCTVPGTAATDQCVLITTVSTTVSAETTDATDQQTTTVTMDTTMTTPTRRTLAATEGCTCDETDYFQLAVGLGVISGLFLLAIIALSIVVSFLAIKLRRIIRAQRLLQQIQQQGGGIAKPGTELVLVNPTFNEPRYEEVDEKIIQQPTSMDDKLEDNPAYEKTVPNTRTT